MKGLGYQGQQGVVVDFSNHFRFFQMEELGYELLLGFLGFPEIFGMRVLGL